MFGKSKDQNQHHYFSSGVNCNMPPPQHIYDEYDQRQHQQPQHRQSQYGQQQYRQSQYAQQQYRQPQYEQQQYGQQMTMSQQPKRSQVDMFLQKLQQIQKKLQQIHWQQRHWQQGKNVLSQSQWLSPQQRLKILQNIQGTLQRQLRQRLQTPFQQRSSRLEWEIKSLQMTQQQLQQPLWAELLFKWLNFENNELNAITTTTINLLERQKRKEDSLIASGRKREQIQAREYCYINSISFEHNNKIMALGKVGATIRFNADRGNQIFGGVEIFMPENLYKFYKQVKDDQTPINHRIAKGLNGIKDLIKSFKGEVFKNRNNESFDFTRAKYDFYIRAKILLNYLHEQTNAKLNFDVQQLDQLFANKLKEANVQYDREMQNLERFVSEKIKRKGGQNLMMDDSDDGSNGSVIVNKDVCKQNEYFRQEAQKLHCKYNPPVEVNFYSRDEKRNFFNTYKPNKDVLEYKRRKRILMEQRSENLRFVGKAKEDLADALTDINGWFTAKDAIKHKNYNEAERIAYLQLISHLYEGAYKLTSPKFVRHPRLKSKILDPLTNVPKILNAGKIKNILLSILFVKKDFLRILLRQNNAKAFQKARDVLDEIMRVISLHGGWYKKISEFIKFRESHHYTCEQTRISMPRLIEEKRLPEISFFSFNNSHFSDYKKTLDEADELAEVYSLAMEVLTIEFNLLMKSVNVPNKINIIRTLHARIAEYNNSLKFLVKQINKNSDDLLREIEGDIDKYKSTTEKMDKLLEEMTQIINTSTYRQFRMIDPNLSRGNEIEYEERYDIPKVMKESKKNTKRKKKKKKLKRTKRKGSLKLLRIPSLQESDDFSDNNDSSYDASDDTDVSFFNDDHLLLFSPQQLLKDKEVITEEADENVIGNFVEDKKEIDAEPLNLIEYTENFDSDFMLSYQQQQHKQQISDGGDIDLRVYSRMPLHLRKSKFGF